MSKFAKTSLIFAVILFGLSFVEPFQSFGWGILRPLAFIAYILFFIPHVLAREMALYQKDLPPGKAPKAAEPETLLHSGATLAKR